MPCSMKDMPCGGGAGSFYIPDGDVEQVKFLVTIPSSNPMQYEDECPQHEENIVSDVESDITSPSTAVSTTNSSHSEERGHEEHDIKQEIAVVNADALSFTEPTVTPPMDIPGSWRWSTEIHPSLL